MKTTTKALLIGLIVAAAGPALAQSTPINILDAQVSPGSATFSGLGTGQIRPQAGNSQALNVGLTTNLSAATSAESTPDYASSGAVSAVVATGGAWNQTFGITSKVREDTTSSTGGVTSTTATGVDDLITGSFVGSFDTTSDSAAGTSKSDVDLAGVSSTSVLGLETSSIDLTTGSRVPDSVATDNASGSASGNIAASTTAAATVSTSDFTSGFIQTFSPSDSGMLTGIELDVDDSALTIE